MDAQVLAALRRVTAAEDGALAAARTRAGTRSPAPPAPEVGALLRWLTTALDLRTAVEVGAAGGVSGLWLLPSLPGRVALTSIESDVHAHRLAADAFAEAGCSDRVRAILGDPTTVLSRLSDASYDLVLLQPGGPVDPPTLDHAARLLRPGGALVVRHVLRPDRAHTAADRLAELVEDDRFAATVLPLDDGLVLAIRSADQEERTFRSSGPSRRTPRQGRG